MSPVVDPFLDERIDEWRRAATSWGWGSASGCASAEGRYRSPQVWDAPGPQPLPIDQHRAWRVEDAWRKHVRLSRERRLLSLFYVRNLHERACCRELGMRYSEFDIVMIRARELLKRGIEKEDSGT